MTRITLPSTRPDGSNNWVEIRDYLRPLDYSAVQQVKIIIPTTPDGREGDREIRSKNETDQRLALLARVITDWSFEGTPIPSKNIADPDELIDSVIYGDDWPVTAEAVQPLLDRIQKRPGKPEDKTATESQTT